MWPTGSRRGSIHRPGIYSTGSDAESAFINSKQGLEDAVTEAKGDGYRYMFLIPTCSSEIIGNDIPGLCGEMSAKHSVEMIPVQSDRMFLGSKFGGTFGLFDALISRMRPKAIEENTVNLVARWFYGLGKDRSMGTIDDLLSLMGLRVRFTFLDFSTMSEIEDFCRAEYDIQLGHTDLNRRVAERISEATGRRMPLVLDIPDGLEGCLKWVRGIAEYAPKTAHLLPEAERRLRERYGSLIRRYRPVLEGRRMVLYCLMVRDVKWQVETLKDLGADITVMFAKGPIINNNLRHPDYGDTPVINEAGICDLSEMYGREGFDIVLTNNQDTVSRAGFLCCPLGSRHYAMDGVEDWLRVIHDSLRIGNPTWEGGL